MIDNDSDRGIQDRETSKIESHSPYSVSHFAGGSTILAQDNDGRFRWEDNFLGIKTALADPRVD